MNSSSLPQSSLSTSVIYKSNHIIHQRQVCHHTSQPTSGTYHTICRCAVMSSKTSSTSFSMCVYLMPFQGTPLWDTRALSFGSQLFSVPLLGAVLKQTLLRCAKIHTDGEVNASSVFDMWKNKGLMGSWMCNLTLSDTTCSAWTSPFVNLPVI